MATSKVEITAEAGWHEDGQVILRVHRDDFDLSVNQAKKLRKELGEAIKEAEEGTW